MHWLAKHRLLWEIMMAGGTFGTVFLEISLPFLVWQKRLRPIYVFASMTLHISIAIFMGLVAFSLLMATMVMSFIPGETVELVLGRMRQRLLGATPVGEAGTARRPAAASPSPESSASPAEEAAGSDPESQTAITVDKDKGRWKKQKSA